MDNGKVYPVIGVTPTGFSCVWYKPNVAAQKHRIDAPALCYLDRSGNVLPGSCEFWMYGKRMRFKKFKEQYEIVHLTIYPYSASEIPTEDLEHCRSIIKSRKQD